MRVHIVQKGDTLWKIAKQYAIGFDDLKRLNAHLANPDYIVPGMEIYLPDTAGTAKKEVRQVVKEQPKPVKEQVIPKPTPLPAPVPAPAPKPAPQPQAQKPFWQGDIYLQQPQPPMPPMPNWQVHVQPTFENTINAPQPMPMPQPMPQQPIIIQQPQPQFIQPMPMPQHMPIQHMPMTHMPVCPSCHRPAMEAPMQMLPYMPMDHCMPMQMQPYMPMDHSQHMPNQLLPYFQDESSPRKEEHCHDKDQLVHQYYEEINHMMRQQNPCCHPQMMPYPASAMPQMQSMPHPPKSCR